MFMLLVSYPVLCEIFSFIKSNIIFLEPLKLYGEGDYNLNVVKEVKVTESFLGLDSDVKGCNMEETFENCTTKIYVETVTQKCGCLPFNIYLSDKVQTLSTSRVYKITFCKAPLCSSQQLQCVKNISTDTSQCRPMCEGLLVTSYSRSDNQRTLEQYTSLVGKDYDNYKTFVKYPASIKGSQGKCLEKIFTVN